MPTVTGYRITCTEAYSAWETGSAYSWEPWGANTPYYRGYSEELRVTIPDDAHLASSAAGQLLMYREGETYGHSAQAAIDLGLAQVQD